MDELSLAFDELQLSTGREGNHEFPQIHNVIVQSIHLNPARSTSIYKRHRKYRPTSRITLGCDMCLEYLLEDIMQIDRPLPSRRLFNRP